MHLKSAYFKGNHRLERAANGDLPLAVGETGHATALLQAAIVSQKYKLPISTRKKHGAPDGIYGKETLGAVEKFQIDHKLKATGNVDRATILCLDSLLPAAPHPKLPKHPPKPPPPLVPAKASGPGALPASPDFKIGTADPTITPDKGAGPWNSKSKSPLTAVQYVAIQEILPTASVLIGRDAAKHMGHYLDNSGSTLVIDLEGMVADVPSAKALFQLEVSKIKDYVEHLPPGTHDVTAIHAVNGYNRQSESRNWFFAVGGYSVWAKGRAKVSGTGPGHDCQLELEYKFYDRYNWDHGKSVTIAHIRVTDDAMGEFHLEGMAKEYDDVGTIRRRLQWKAGGPIPPAQLDP